ncbi:hypothetical protein [Pengzhenrongella frigida]|uniref:hypothetical protein n=1 Tax=Pengzhenrongella frigida TaxID=1259133 RepID=UPI001A938F04|nr:hypothetical protein [Cellulomonas sp. HLT2-17]
MEEAAHPVQPEPAPDEAGSPAPVDLARVWNLVGTVVAPATLVSALLFYFGYVSARAQFAYFGVDVDTLGFSTQEFVMRAPQPLLVPTLVLLLGTAALVWGNGAVRRRLDAVPSGSASRWLVVLRSAGAVLLGVALVLLLAFPLVGSWPAFPLVTPALLGVGAGLLARGATWATGRSRPGRTTIVLLVLVVVASVFWLTATLAQWSGTGQAKALARDLVSLPAVVVDTAEPLFAGDPAVVETTFPPEEGQTYRYRYRGLRLLAEGDGRLFLVPERWSPSGSTFVVDFDRARVRFRFVDDPP